MDQEPDNSSCWLQGHYGTRDEAEAMAEDIEKLIGFGQWPKCRRIEVERDRQGSWNVWIWE